jgi:4-hydroxybutyrate dehydrogenase
MSIIQYLTTIRLAEGAVSGLPQDMAEVGMRRPLIVTDKGLRASGTLDALLAAASVLADAPVFDDVPSNPTEAAAKQALALYRAGGCDGLVALGGGSPMDLAKAVAILATHPEPLSQYALVLGGLARITAAVAPVIAIPTTAGTGSEVGRGAVINLEDGRKLALISPHLIPRRAICDPELTYGLPARLTAATGMDALTHCVEIVTSPRDNPTAEAIALDGLERAMAHIERATADGSDKTARREMMIAALHGGLTFQKGLGAVHALSHPLGTLTNPSLHHGMLNAVLLPHVLRFNVDHAPGKYARLRRAMGLPDGADVAQAVHDLVARLKLPLTLSEMGAPSQVLPSIAASAMLDHCHATNARTATEAEYLGLLTAAFR